MDEVLLVHLFATPRVYFVSRFVLCRLVPPGMSWEYSILVRGTEKIFLGVIDS